MYGTHSLKKERRCENDVTWIITKGLIISSVLLSHWKAHKFFNVSFRQYSNKGILFITSPFSSFDLYQIQPGASGKKPALLPPSRSPSTLPLPIKKKGGSTVGKPDGRFGGERMAVLHCRHCLEEFRPEENVRGACEFGPDPVMGAIERASCMPCVECVLYHCWRDDDEAGAPRRPSSRRWAALAILSVIVPCLWLYYPLKACHRCGQSCALCGARHEAWYDAWTQGVNMLYLTL